MKCGVAQSRIFKIGCLVIFLSLVLLFQLTGLSQVTWTEDEIASPTFSDTRSTLVHCVGENFLQGSSWHFKSCHYRNLCHEDGQWTIHPSTMQLQMEDSNLYLSTKLQQNVSSIGLRPAWVRTKQYQWSPRLASDTKMATSSVRHVDSTVIIISVPPFESMIAFLFDTLFPIYNLIELFYLSEQTKKTRIQVNVLNIEDFHDISWLEKGLSWMGYELFSPNESINSSRVCFSNAAAGIGMLTVTGLSKRGTLATDYQPATKLRNHARGSTLYQFRNHLLRTAFKNFDPVNVTPIGGMNKIQLALTNDQNDLARVLEAAFANKQQGYDMQLVDWSFQSPDKLMEAAQTSGAWIAFANNDNCTWPAFFLPEGANLILLYDSKALVKTKKPNAKARPVKLDFGLWNQLSHIRVHWLSLSHPTDTLAAMISDILMNHLDSGSGVDRHVDQASTKVTFNGLPVREIKSRALSDSPSKVHCIGENWMWNAAHYRSCHVQRLCFDTNSKSFVFPTILASKHADGLLPMDSVSTWVDAAKTKVMVGHAIRHSTAEHAWFPQIQPRQYLSYYALDSDVVWMPIFTEQPNIHNPGHLLWDFWLPMYTLLELFLFQEGGMDDHSSTLLLTNLDSTCTNETKCYSMVSKFLPFLGAQKDSFFSSGDSHLSGLGTDNSSSYLVCAENTLMGIGMLTDHGSKKHGQLLEDYQSVQNIGRGPMFWRFRNFMLKNLAGRGSSLGSRPPWRITFSINSSQNPSRRRNFEQQIEIAKQLYPPENNKLRIIVETVQLDQLTLEAQTKLMDETAIFVSVMGGSASTAVFLRQDASLVLYYNDIDDFVKGNGGSDRVPNRMDWDFWNNASYLRVHWLPIQGMDAEEDLKYFAKLLQHEVNTGILAG